MALLTRAGLVTLVVSIVVLAGARAFGLPELFVIGAGGLTLLMLAVGYVAVRRLQVEVTRHLNPPQVRAGNPCRVDLTLRNRSRLRSPVLRLSDDVSGTRGVELMVAPMATGAGTQAVYRLPTERRGLVQVGPLRLTVTDPFGLARLTTTGDRDMTLVVYPHVDELSPVRRSAGSDIERQRTQQQHIAPVGDEFHALRQWQIGDDHRRIHWRSSARQDELMVRQDELPWHGRVTVFLDAGESGPVGAMSDAAFESVVSAAASIAAASIDRGDQVRMLCTNGLDSGFATGTHHLNHILGDLARVERDDHAAGPTMDALLSQGSGGMLVIVGCGGDEANDLMLRAAASRYRGQVRVVFGDERAIPGGVAATLRSAVVVVVPPGSEFVDAWQRAFGVVRAGRR